GTPSKGSRPSGCRKSHVRLFRSLRNAVTFPQLRSVKVLAARAARLAKQGFAGHSISFEAGLAPSSSPRRCAVFTSEESFSTRIRAGPLQRGPALMHFSAWSGQWTGGESSEIPRPGLVFSPFLCYYYQLNSYRNPRPERAGKEKPLDRTQVVIPAADMARQRDF